MQTNAWLSARRLLIIGHRGASALLPENSLAACALAVEQGADGIEVDVQLTRDGAPVLVHDSELRRLTGNPRKVSQLTSSEIKSEQLEQGHSIAFLEELFDLLGDGTLYNLELKEFGIRDSGLVRCVADAVAAYGLQSKTLVSSFNPLVVRRARRMFSSRTAIALLRAPGLWRYSSLFVEAEADNPHHSLVDDAYMVRAKQRGYHIYVWTVDDVAEAARLRALGVNGIITNDPAGLREQLKMA